MSIHLLTRYGLTAGPIAPLAPFDPASVEGIVAWLDASDGTKLTQNLIEHKDNAETLSVSGSNPSNTLRIGSNATNSQPMVGQQAEIVIMRGTPSAATRDGVLSYFQNKWGVGYAGPSATSVDPSGLPDVELWLDASDASTIAHTDGAVTSWTSKDTNGRVFSQATSALQPVTGSTTLNGENTIAFDGDYLESDDTSSVWKFLHDGTIYTVFAVARFEHGDNRMLFATNTGGANTVGAAYFFDGAGKRFRTWVTRGSTGYAVLNQMPDESVGDGVWNALYAESDAANATAADRSVLSLGRDRNASQLVSKDTSGLVFGQGTAAWRPSLVRVNGRTALLANGRYLESTLAASEWKFLHDGSEYTVVAAVRFNAKDRYNAAWHTGALESADTGFAVQSDSNESAAVQNRLRHYVARGSAGTSAVNNPNIELSVPNGAPVVLSVLADPDNAVGAERSKVRVNAGDPYQLADSTYAPSDSNPTTTLRVGNRGTTASSSNVVFCEGFIIDRQVSASDRQNLETYLRNRWAPTPLARIGLVTDVHYSDKATSGTRNYRDADDKLADAVTLFNGEMLDAVIELGDFIDHVGDTSANALADLAVIEAVYDDLTAPRYYALGNHDLDAISKAQFISGTGMTDNYYFVDVGANARLIVLDPTFRTDDDDDPYGAGNFDHAVSYVPPNQRSWLQNTALSTNRACVVFCHYRLDTASSDAQRVNNASVVRGILEEAGNVVGVFTGHAHTNARVLTNSIPYFVMQAVVEKAHPHNALAVLNVYEDHVVIAGYGGEVGYPE